MVDQKQYILGTDLEELNRLKLQHDLWVDEALPLWKQVGFAKASHLLDLGCGPGFTTLALAKMMEPGAIISAVDMSESFLHHLQSQAVMQSRIKIEVLHSPVEKLTLPVNSVDGAYCRWLMIFVKDPGLAIRKIAEVLKPGASFVLQEYVTYDSMALAPESAIMNKVVKAIFQSWRDQGGDPNRGRVLPSLLEQNGFQVQKIEPLAKFARPQDPLWQWPDSFYRSFIPRLVQGNYLSQVDCESFFVEWNSIKDRPGSFFIAPTMINIIATKR